MVAPKHTRSGIHTHEMAPMMALLIVTIIVLIMAATLWLQAVSGDPYPVTGGFAGPYRSVVAFSG